MDRNPTLTDQLCALKPGESRIFGDAKPQTLRRLAHRLKGEKLAFVCKDTPDGFTVWRTA